MSTKAARNIIIGGTIAVPTEGTIDSLDISCRSDLTQDLIPEYGQPFHSRPPTYPPRYHREFLRNNSADDNVALPATTLERVVPGSSHNSFHTAANSRGSGTPNGREEDGDDLVDDEYLPDLDEQAEQAASHFFGADADRVLDGPPRRSVLVSKNSTIDVSWFAARGLMSRHSFERYQEEMKSKVIHGASSNNLRSLGKGGRRWASISMGDLRNEPWPIKKMDVENTSAAVASKSNLPTPPLPSRRKKSAAPRHKSVDEGLDYLVKSGSVDKLVESIISAIKHGDAQAQGIKANASPKNDDQNPKDKENEVDNSTSDLNSEEIQLLSKMMRRLSQEDDDASPFQSDVDDDSSIQDEILERIPSRDCSEDDLMDSSTWEGNPGDLHLDVTSHMDDASVVQLTSSIMSSATLKMDHARATMDESIARDIGHKYVPQRTSGIELKGAEPFQVHAVDFSSSTESRKEDSFYITTVERKDTLSSMLPTPGEETDDDESIFASLSPQSRTPIVVATKFERRSDAIGSLSPRRKSSARSDTTIPLSPKSPHELQREERDDLHSSTNFLDRCQSLASVTTLGAVASPELSREDSISTSCTMPLGQSRPIHQFERGHSIGTDCAVATIHDELDNSHSMAFGAKNPPPGNNDRPASPCHRHSLSSHSSGEGRIMRRNSSSFSSLFSAPIDLDTLEGPPLKEDCGDILQEGQEYLSMAMLVNVYSKLRELSMLGHASVKLVDIDVNSHQSLARKKEMKRLGLLESEDEPYLDNTKTAGFVVRTVLDEYEMFEASNELSAVFSQANHAAMVYDASLLSEFKTWVEESRVKQLDSATEEVIKTLREECVKHQLLVKERSSANVCRDVARRRCSLGEKRRSFQEATWLKQERTLIADHFGIRGGISPSNSNCDIRDNSRGISRGVLTESMIEKTIEKSHDYFQEGSSLRNLLEAGLEVVWFSDRHPSDIIYCICVNRETATVTVVFRGQESLFDLFRDSAMTSYSNPIMHEDYEGNSKFINLRAAVSDEMMRVRRDNKKSTIDEIRGKVDKIGKELTDGGLYHLSVAGHGSLGGGLATVVGFYLASDPSLELASAVRVFTFASARVGCKAFQQGFKHLEETGRLQHARFTNSNETVSLLPVCDVYHHVGMQLRLHKPTSAGRQRTRQSLDVSYNSSVSRLGEAFRFMLSCLSAGKSSRLSEYQHRMHFAREYRLALSDGVLRFDKKRNHLKSLNDYYLMKCRLSDYMGFTKKRESMPSFLLFFLVSCLISFEIAILFKFIAVW